ncbi:Protein PRD1 [Bienertia sinuspersici]
MSMEYKDQIVSSCVKVLDLLSIAENAFRQRLSLGFTTLVSVLPHVVEVPFHHVQPQMLKLILGGISTSPGVVFVKLVEAISCSLTLILQRHIAGEMGMLPEIFVTICSIFVVLVKSPSASGTSTLMSTVLEASRHAVLASLSMDDVQSNQLLHSLSFLKQAYSFTHEISSTSNSADCRDAIEEFSYRINGLEEESILGILETLDYVLLQTLDNQALQLTHALLSLSWFSLSFRCLGLYPTGKMKLRVHLMLTVASTLPTDPVDLLFLLGLKNDLELSSCQTDVLQILYISSLLADKKLILTSLEQYMLANSSHLLSGAADSIRANGWTEEHLLGLGVLSLVFHHSTLGALLEIAKFVFLNSSLASLMRATVDGFFANGSASIEQEEESDTEHTLVFLLLYSHFYLEDYYARYGLADILQFTRRTCPLPSIGIFSQAVCRFLHLGSSLVKLVASYCLIDLLSGITDIQLESLLGNAQYESYKYTTLARNNSWSKTIVEELARSLAASSSVLTSLMNHHKPAVQIATALLRSATFPLWMNSVFNEACVCVSGIIKNLSPTNTSVEVTLVSILYFCVPYELSFELRGMQNNKECVGEQGRKVVIMSSVLREVCEFLLQLMSSEPFLVVYSAGYHVRNNKLMEETDLLLRFTEEMESLTARCN